VRNVLTALSATFSLAVRRGWIASNPVSGLTKGERPSSRKRQHRILNSDEIRRAIAAAGKRSRVLVIVAVFGGLRQGELLGLTWADVDLDGARLKVRSHLQRGTRTLVATKTEKGVREVPLPAFVVRALREQKLASRWSLPEHPVFPSDAGGPLHHRNVGRMWARVREAAGMAEPLPVFHDMRHTSASLWIAEGLDVVWVSRVMGHSSPSVTLDLYADLFDRARHDERATMALDAAFGELLEVTAS
jgi:integrase